MIKYAIFMLGLPGSGKSFYIQNNKELARHYLVSADKIRLKHPKYNPKEPEAIHAECVNLAEQLVYEYAENNYNIVMDGSGINNHYTLRIITKLKNMGYRIKVVFIDTPVDICCLRNRERFEAGERFVPISAIIEKSYKLRKSIETLRTITDDFEVVSYFSDKNVFVDLDGTVAEYQTLPTDEFGNINFVEYEVFKYSKPVYEVINKIRKLSEEGKEIYIISASPNSIASKEKAEWVNKYMPFVKTENIYFAGNKNFKYVFLQELMSKLKLFPQDCMVIDDDHAVITTYRQLFVNVVHPSKFLTNY